MTLNSSFSANALRHYKKFSMTFNGYKIFVNFPKNYFIQMDVKEIFILYSHLFLLKDLYLRIKDVYIRLFNALSQNIFFFLHILL